MSKTVSCHVGHMAGKCSWNERRFGLGGLRQERCGLLFAIKMIGVDGDMGWLEKLDVCLDGVRGSRMIPRWVPVLHSLSHFCRVVSCSGHHACKGMNP